MSSEFKESLNILSELIKAEKWESASKLCDWIQEEYPSPICQDYMSFCKGGIQVLSTVRANFSA